jgi:hypothetical protein
MSYFKQKLYEALHDLVSDGDIDKRLTYAATYFVHLQERDVPQEYLERFRVLKEKLVQTPLSSERGYVPRQLSTEDANALAREILGLFTDVMGGL